MTKSYSDLDRYRELLRDADDEPKRLALTQLLIDEGAKNKLASLIGVGEPKSAQPLPAVAPLALLPGAPIDGPATQIVAEHHRDVSWESLPRSAVRSEAASAMEFVSTPSDSSAGADLESNTAELLSGPELSADEAPIPEIASIASEPRHSNDLTRRIAMLLRDSTAPAEAPPAGATRQPPAAPVSNEVAEYSGAWQIRAAMGKYRPV